MLYSDCYRVPFLLQQNPLIYSNSELIVSTNTSTLLPAVAAPSQPLLTQLFHNFPQHLKSEFVTTVQNTELTRNEKQRMDRRTDTQLNLLGIGHNV